MWPFLNGFCCQKFQDNIPFSSPLYYVNPSILYVFFFLGLNGEVVISSLQIHVYFLYKHNIEYSSKSVKFLKWDSDIIISLLQAGVELILNPSDDEFLVAMFFSLSKLASVSTLLISEQVIAICEPSIRVS